jgi:hypothetical protein
VLIATNAAGVGQWDTDSRHAKRLLADGSSPSFSARSGAMNPRLTALLDRDDALKLQRGEAVVIHGASGAR